MTLENIDGRRAWIQNIHSSACPPRLYISLPTTTYYYISKYNYNLLLHFQVPTWSTIACSYKPFSNGSLICNAIHLVNPLTRVTNRSSVNQFLVPTCFVSHLSRNATMPVRCMAGQVMKSNRATCIFFFLLFLFMESSKTQSVMEMF